MKSDKIISALIGLAGACSNNPKTAATDRLVIRALALPLLHPEYGDAQIEALVGEIRAEKNAIAPGCAVCAAPCGNTSDYNMRRIDGDTSEIGELKRQILSKTQALAADAYLRAESAQSPEIDVLFFFRALSYLSYDLEKDTLLELLHEAEALERSAHKHEGGIPDDSENY